MDHVEHKDHAHGANGGPDMAKIHTGQHIDPNLHRLVSAQSIVLSPDQFEKLYLSPQTQVKGDLRKTFANPTPLAITGFVVGLTPLSMILLEWRGSGELGTAIVGAFWFIAGPALWLGGILEFFLGNTFSFVVFVIYGGVFFGWAVELTPWFSAGKAYAPNQNFFVGELEPSFASSLAFWVLTMGILSFIFMICSLRVNLVFFLVFFTAAMGFVLLSASFFQKGNGNMSLGLTLQKACGGFWFVASLLGWYLILVEMFAAVGLPINLPVGDFSRLWPDGKTEKAEDAEKQQQEGDLAAV